MIEPATLPPGGKRGVWVHPNYGHELEILMDVLPPMLRDVTEPHKELLEEIYMDLGQHPAITVDGEYRILSDMPLLSKDDLAYLSHRVGGFKSNNRAGLEGTLHRISRIQDAFGETVGVTIRVGKFVMGVAEPLREYLLSGGGSILLVGPPRTGKTTLLRDVVRVLAERWGPRVVAVDTSNEIGGDGKITHVGIVPARRMQVPDPPSKNQAGIIYQAIANHSPEIVVADEIGYNEDVEVVQAAARRGVRVVATVHGEQLLDVLENPVLHPLIGQPDMERGKRTMRPSFSMALQMVAKGRYRLYPDLAGAVDALLQGEQPEEVELSV